MHPFGEPDYENGQNASLHEKCKFQQKPISSFGDSFFVFFFDFCCILHCTATAPWIQTSLISVSLFLIDVNEAKIPFAKSVQEKEIQQIVLLLPLPPLVLEFFAAVDEELLHFPTIDAEFRRLRFPPTENPFLTSS